MKQKVEFISNGVTLRGLLETPAAPVRCYALFAHCFTCGKDSIAASRVAGALTEQGIAVLRFDFTGLGGSDGDFSNTNFSSNLQDLHNAIEFLRGNFDAPQLLIGHSLGGAAVLAIAGMVPEVKAVVTIGAPSDAHHVIHNFSQAEDEIRAQGQAKVQLGPREFLIKQQLLDDLEQYEKAGIGLGKQALLVMHSPLDDTVPLAEAEKIYQQAKHPKSFISLDSANHLLTSKQDAAYVAQSIVAWADRYLPPLENWDGKPPQSGYMIVEEKDHVFTQHVVSDHHYWLADEPLAVGGQNMGPDPYEHLLAALGACTSMTLRMYANMKKLPLEHIRVELHHDRNYLEDCQDENCPGIEALVRTIHLTGELDQDQRQKLLQIADKCPVHRSLHNDMGVVTKLADI